MKPASESDFKQCYATHLKRLRLQGLRPKTIDAYARAVREAKIDKQRLRVCASAALDAASSTHLQPFDVILRRHRLISQKLSA